MRQEAIAILAGLTVGLIMAATFAVPGWVYLMLLTVAIAVSLIALDDE